MTVTQPVLVPEDGLLLGNGDLSVSVYQTRDRIIFRFGKGDVWDRRVDYSDDPKPPTIQEIAHGIGVERWKCNPYGDGEAVALNGTDNPQRMKELCKGTPPSYFRRPYPCPKPVGELALQLPPDLPGLTVRQELTVEEGILRIVCSWPAGVELRLTCFIPPQPNVLVVQVGTDGLEQGDRDRQQSSARLVLALPLGRSDDPGIRPTVCRRVPARRLLRLSRMPPSAARCRRPRCASSRTAC